MGGEHSQGTMESYGVTHYNLALQKPCLLPGVSIDKSLLKYAGLDSNYQLQQFSNQLVGIIPGYLPRLGSSLAPFTTVPNAVGLGALVISVFLDIIIKGALQKENSIDLLRRVFGEEKASAVRDTMAEYLQQHYIFLNDTNRLQEELHRLQALLSLQLTQLRNSMLDDGQMSTRSFNIWVNGASFHVLMRIHEARLKIQNGQPSSYYVNTISTSIDLYVLALDRLLEKYKTYWSNKVRLNTETLCSFQVCSVYGCKHKNTENNCEAVYPANDYSCNYPDVKEAFVKHVFSTHGPILGLKSHFLNMKTNLNVLINQHDSFTLPSAA